VFEAAGDIFSRRAGRLEGNGGCWEVVAITLKYQLPEHITDTEGLALPDQPLDLLIAATELLPSWDPLVILAENTPLTLSLGILVTALL